MEEMQSAVRFCLRALTQGAEKEWPFVCVVGPAFRVPSAIGPCAGGGLGKAHRGTFIQQRGMDPCGTCTVWYATLWCQCTHRTNWTDRPEGHGDDGRESGG